MKSARARTRSSTPYAPPIITVTCLPASNARCSVAASAGESTFFPRSSSKTTKASRSTFASNRSDSSARAASPSREECASKTQLTSNGLRSRFSYRAMPSATQFSCFFPTARTLTATHHTLTRSRDDCGAGVAAQPRNGLCPQLQRACFFPTARILTATHHTLTRSRDDCGAGVAAQPRNGLCQAVSSLQSRRTVSKYAAILPIASLSTATLGRVTKRR